MSETPAWGTAPDHGMADVWSSTKLIGRTLTHAERRLRATAKAGAGVALFVLVMLLQVASDGASDPIPALEVSAAVTAAFGGIALLAHYVSRWRERRAARRAAPREPGVDEKLLPLLHPAVGVAVPEGANAFDLSRGGRFLATHSSALFWWTTRVWDLDAGRLVWTGRSSEELDVVLVDDNMTLVTSTDRKLFWYDLWRGVSKSRKYQGLGSVSRLAWHPDGRHVVAGTSGGTVALVPLTTSKRPSPVGDIGIGVTALAVDPEGNRIAAGDMRGGVHVWDVRVDRPVLDVESDSRAAVTTIGFRDDAGVVETVEADGTCHRWHVGSGRLLSTFTVPGAEQLAVDGRGDAVAVVDGEDNLVLWDQATRRPTARLAVSGRIKALSARTGGTCLAAATRDRMVWVWLWPDRGGRPS